MSEAVLGMRAGAEGGTTCNTTAVLRDNIHTPDGLAVDWVHNLLFWTDTGHNTISVVHIDDPTKVGAIDFGDQLDSGNGHLKLHLYP